MYEEFNTIRTILIGMYREGIYGIMLYSPVKGIREFWFSPPLFRGMDFAGINEAPRITPRQNTILF